MHIINFKEKLENYEMRLFHQKRVVMNSIKKWIQRVLYQR